MDVRTQGGIAPGTHARPEGRARGAVLPPAPPAPPMLAALGAATDWAVVGIGATMIVLVFVNVCLHVVHLDLAWVTELAELLMVWVTFLGGACATRRGAQMTITEFIDKLEGGRRRAADAAVDLFAIAVLVSLVWHGVNLVIAGWGNQLTVLQIPMSFQYLGMPVGCALMLVWLAWDVWRIARGDTREERWGAQGG
jgi:TRAP-type C4-dicarboxylate transport system permease small subunit